MKKQGIDIKVKELAGKGVPVVGICGGYQILGETISDPLGIEGTKDHRSSTWQRKRFHRSR